VPVVLPANEHDAYLLSNFSFSPFLMKKQLLLPLRAAAFALGLGLVSTAAFA